LRTTYDAATRSIEIRFAQPPERLRTVRVQLLDGLTGFDGGPITPWSLTFSIAP
jgi:glutamate mutase epsilon subunit